MRELLLILSVFAVLISNACTKVMSQLTSAPLSEPTNEQINQESESQNLVGDKKNAKYGLTVLFYRVENQEPTVSKNSNLSFDRVVIGQDKTNKKSKLIEIRDGFMVTFQDVWSPNQDYLLLPGSVCGQSGFCVYKTSDVVDGFEQNSDFQAGNPLDFIKLTFTDFRPKSERGKVKPCEHFFESWSGEASVVFAVKAIESKDGRSRFKYDLAQQKLFGGLEKYGLGDNGFNAANKTGKLRFVRE